MGIDNKLGDAYLGSLDKVLNMPRWTSQGKFLSVQDAGARGSLVCETFETYGCLMLVTHATRYKLRRFEEVNIAFATLLA